MPFNVKDSSGNVVSVPTLDEVFGPRTDAKTTATDATPVSPMSIWKQISDAAQSAASHLAQTLASSIADGAHATFGAKSDARSTATDATAISAMSVWKQVSFSLQALGQLINAGALTVAGTVTANLAAGASGGTAIIGTVLTRPRLTTATRRNVAASATAVDLFPAGVNYQPGSHALNNSPEAMYINEDGTNPTTSVYGDVINPGEVYVVDTSLSTAVRVIWPSANGGFARVTDFTS
jgi:hypothetical protein